MSTAPQARTILVVDDESGIRGTLDRTFRHMGYTVLLAADPVEGLRIALEARPQVIFVDIRMPFMDGHTLLRRLNAQGSQAAVIIMSAHGEREDVVDALRNGAVDYLQKPWSQADLISAVGRAVDAYAKRVPGAAQAASIAPSTAAAAPAAAPAPTPAASPAPSEAAAVPNLQDPIFKTILKRIERSEIPIPAAMAVVMDLRARIARPQTTFQDVAHLIERDPQLATKVLSISNSAFYSRGSPNSDLCAAVSRIGLRQVMGFVETVIYADCYRVRDPALAPLQERTWRHSVAKAVSMRAIAKTVPMQLDPETAYVAGLLMDVGASFLLWLLSERRGTGEAAPKEPPQAFVQQYHQQIGGALLSRWSIDPVVAGVAGVHHSLPKSNPYQACLNMAHVGQSLAEKIFPEADWTNPGPPDPTFLQICTQELGLGQSTLEVLAEGAKREVETLLESIGA